MPSHREQVSQQGDKALVIVVTISLVIMYALFFAIFCAVLLDPFDPRRPYDPEVDVAAGFKGHRNQESAPYGGAQSPGVVSLEPRGG